MIKKILFIILFLVLLSPFVEAKNLYVNNSGSPACSDATTYANNSASNPWCSLIRATWGRTDGNRGASANTSEAAQPGDTIYVTAGTYHYSSVFNGAYPSDGLYKTANNGSAGNWITIEAVGTVELTSNTSGDHVIFGGNNYIKWKGFTVNQANIGWRKGWGLIFIAEAYVSIENCTIIGAYHDYGFHNNHAGIMVHGPRDGACIGALSNVTIKNNRIYGFTGASSRNDTGITLYCLGSDITIENNEIYSNTSGIFSKVSYQDTTNFNIRYNLFHSNVEGIAMSSFYDWHVVQNIFRDNGIAFTWFCTIYYAGSPAPKDTYIVNNTFHNNTHAFMLRWACEKLNDNFVRNNIFTNHTNVLLSVDTVCESTANMGTDDIDHDRNAYHNITGNFFAREGGGLVANWATWRSSYGQDSNSSYGVDPLYVNAAGNNFRLQAGSPARTLGRTITRIHGSSGVTIPAGAYITGNEVIGRISGGGPSPPTGLTIR